MVIENGIVIWSVESNHVHPLIQYDKCVQLNNILENCIHYKMTEDSYHKAIRLN